MRAGARMCSLVAAFIAAAALASNALALTPGSLDPSFASGGIFQHGFDEGTNPNSEAWAVTAQPDGKVVLAGQATDASNRAQVLVARLNPDGSLDPSFGSGGFVLHQFGGGSTPRSEAQGVILEPDGKIVISGEATDSNGKFQVMVARLNPDGSLDSTFGSGAVVLSQQGTGSAVNKLSRVNFESIVLQGSKIVLGGEATDSHSQSQLMIIRLNSDGSFDSSFGSAGVVLDQLGLAPGPRSRVTSLALQSDGKILAGGDGEGSSGEQDFFVVRLNGADGSFDNSFGSAGVVEGQLGSGSPPFSDAFALEPLADGKIIIGGGLSDPSRHELAMLARLNPDGSLDTSFGSGGVSSPQQFGETNPMFPNTPYSYVFSLAVQPNGRIVTGLNVTGTGTDFNISSKIARFNADGTLDTSFGTGGVVVPVQLPASPTSFADQDGMALQPDGNILVGGDDSIGGGQAFVTRLIGDPVPTPSISASPNPASVGQAVSFTGSSSSDPNGAIPSYSWNFAPGENATGANVQHTFTQPGTYNVTLTVTYDDGVIATATKTIAVPAVQLTASQSHRRWQEGNALPHEARAKHPPVGTTFRFKVNQQATVRFAFTQKLPGRKVGHRCVAPNRKNRHKPKCTRTVTRGKLSYSVGAGAHRLRFDGRLSKHKKLAPGRYTVIITATNGAGPPATKRLTFTIVKG